MGPDTRRRLPRSLCWPWTLVLFCCVWVNAEVETINAKAGSFVTFESGTISKGPQREQVLWTFETEVRTMMIVKVNASQVPGPVLAQFQSRLYLNLETGNLTISSLSVNDTGVYKQQLIGSRISSRLFRLMVYNPLSPPSVHFVKSYSGGCDPLQVKCSIENSRNLSLTLFEGNVWLQKTYSLEEDRLSLTFDTEHSQTRAFSCQAQNPAETQCTSFHPTEMCLKNGGSSSWSQSELRLILATIIGLLILR